MRVKRVLRYRNHTNIRVWDSSNLFAEEYVRGCAILERDEQSSPLRRCPSVQFNCNDFLHTGDVALSQATQLLVNDVCNEFTWIDKLVSSFCNDSPLYVIISYNSGGVSTCYVNHTENEFVSCTSMSGERANKSWTKKIPFHNAKQRCNGHPFVLFFPQQ